MTDGARRLSFRAWRADVRRGRLALCAMLAGLAGTALVAQDVPQAQVAWARYDAPTTRCPHGVLGDDVEYGALVINDAGQPAPITLTLPPERVFEDVAPRLADLDGDANHRIGEIDIAGGIRHCGGAPEMIVADKDWHRIVALGFRDGALFPRDAGPHRGRTSFAAAMAC